jgi:hypothetical protein
MRPPNGRDKSVVATSGVKPSQRKGTSNQENNGAQWVLIARPAWPFRYNFAREKYDIPSGFKL